MNRTDELVDRIASAIIASGSEPWQASAACAGQPELTDATRPPKVWDGLALCAACPVIAECRAWVEAEPGYVGIAGGAVWTSRHRGRRSTVHTLEVVAS